jgi:hypothetical protein
MSPIESITSAGGATSKSTPTEATLRNAVPTTRALRPRRGASPARPVEDDVAGELRDVMALCW